MTLGPSRRLLRSAVATLLLCAAGAVIACTSPTLTPGGEGPGPFALACDSADTTQRSTLFCVRTDTRDGDVLVVDLETAPVTTGSSRASLEPAHTYQTVCDSTVTPEQSDFRCLRLNTRTGDIVVLRLSELPRWTP
jgi:hypothetical protein